jgi:hypothetical protein
MELKLKQKNFEMQIRNLDPESKKEIESLCSTNESQYSKRQSMLPASEFEIDMMPTKKK